MNDRGRQIADEMGADIQRLSRERFKAMSSGNLDIECLDPMQPVIGSLIDAVALAIERAMRDREEKS